MASPYLAELTYYFRGAYPPFVYQLNPSKIDDYIPVFISHTVTEEEFEKKLIFIKNNNYQTCTITELYYFITGNFIPKKPTICLTFDDGHESLYNIAFPLLNKYQLRATAFLVPLFINTPGWITWEQAKEMSDSKIIEFQSHTLEHKRIFTGNKIINYYSPGLFKNELGLDKPTIIINETETKDIPDGHPIYKMDSRMSNKLRYLERGNWEDKCQQEDAILYDLKESKKIIEEKLNKPIEHLAYPWGIGSQISQELSQKAGYKTNFWGVLPGIPYNKKGSDPYKLARLKDDYIFRLKGTGRYSLFKIFKEKFKRRKKATSESKDIY